MQDPISKLKSIFKQKNYVWNEYINIIGVRNMSTGNIVTNKFDDKLIVAYFRNNKWDIEEYNVTLDPRKYYTSIKLLNPKGVAIIAEQQCLNIYSIRNHQGKYPALCQTYGAIKLFRDKNLNSVYDYNIFEYCKDSGVNIHKAGKFSIYIDKWSAGCTVFEEEAKFAHFMEICERYKNILKNRYTYTIINSNDLK